LIAMPKQYIGDGVFAEFDTATLNVILTTEDGTRETNRIVLEAEVLDALGRFVQRSVYQRQAPADRQPLDARAHLGDGDGAALEAGARPERDGEISSATFDSEARNHEPGEEG
jgi:hypothetical protein